MSKHFEDAMQRGVAAINAALAETNARAPRTPDTLRERAHHFFLRRWSQTTKERHLREGLERSQVFMAALHRERKRLNAA